MLPPGVVSGLEMDGLLALKPQGHLFDVIAFVARSVGILSIVNVESFRVFCVVSVSTAKCSDRRYIVHERVDLGDIEMIADSKLNEDAFVRMEQAQTVLHSCKSLVCVLLELRVVYELE